MYLKGQTVENPQKLTGQWFHKFFVQDPISTAHSVDTLL